MYIRWNEKMDQWDLFEDEGVAEGDSPEEQEAWFHNLMREIAEINRAAEVWFGNLERAKQDTTRVDLPKALQTFQPVLYASGEAGIFRLPA